MRPVGGDTETSFDVRLVCATNRDLEAMVPQREFREDLYYRINVVQLPLPPLRVRAGDVLLLAQHFIDHFARMFGRDVRGLTPEAAERLLRYALARQRARAAQRDRARGRDDAGPIPRRRGSAGAHPRLPAGPPPRADVDRDVDAARSRRSSAATSCACSTRTRATSSPRRRRSVSIARRCTASSSRYGVERES